jgi:SAM-dependent methyltransferase
MYICCTCCTAPMQNIGKYAKYVHFRCGSCGYEYFKNEDSTQSSDYEDDTDYLDDLELFPKAGDRIQWHHRRALDFFAKQLPVGATTLDVGCFDGFFVRQLCNQGFDAHGVDFNRNALASGMRQFGLYGRISNRPVGELLAETRRFDVVTLFEVIEHLDDFDPVLRDCVALLKPGGHLVISTPNNNMTWRPPLDFPPHHLSRFNPDSLRSIALRFGLEPVSSVEQSSLFDLVRNYTGALFRRKDMTSMRGGQFRNRSIVDPLRLIANRSKWAVYALLWPIDKLLHAAGFRYIGQLMIARNMGR